MKTEFYWMVIVMKNGDRFRMILDKSTFIDLEKKTNGGKDCKDLFFDFMDIYVNPDAVEIVKEINER